MRRIVTSLLVCAAVAAAAPARATPLGSNLIVNGDAESCVPGPSGYEVVAIPGWSVLGNLTAVSWTTGGGFPVNSDPGPAVRGAAFFAGGPEEDLSEMSQTIDISDLAALIDAGSLNFRLAGYLGGYNGQQDNAQLTATFRDGAATTVGSATIGPVFITDRAGLTGMVLRAQEGAVPPGTRTVQLQLVCTRTAGSYDDGYADSLTFVLSHSTASVVPGGASAAIQFLPVSPNPVRGAARFAFRLPQSGEARLDVYDLVGRRVETVLAGALAEGDHAVTWKRGADITPGVYFARLQVGAEALRRPFVVLD
uniref:T9SS type A sorting domain-containing protein n=1 Tax=Eiseniibacteriota bacterium TaxID=2212470 RepID=A0A832I108_UNCEI